jgi:beta-glucosidase
MFPSQAILFGTLPGQEFGNALADVLFGVVNPSAKLIVTLPNTENEVGFTPEQYPGVNLQANYSEKFLIGYRWYTVNQRIPAYPFGHGLSYTTFAYTKLSASSTQVKITVQNTGSRNGAEVAQMYLEFPAYANTPPLQLKGFVKTPILEPDESYVVIFPLTLRDISVWNIETHEWQVVRIKSIKNGCVVSLFLYALYSD